MPLWYFVNPCTRRLLDTFEAEWELLRALRSPLL